LSGVEANTINLGASDPFMTTAQSAAYPGILNIPVAVSSQAVNYNLPGIPITTHLNFTGNVLAGIYNGTITTWNNAAIAKLNPSVALPGNTIVPLHRSDSSGDTFLITSYMYMAWTGWAAHSFATAKLSGTLNANIQYASGNSGMVTLASSTPDSIAYIGNSYEAKTTAAGLGQASVANKAGKYTTATPAAISAALASFPAVPAAGAEQLINTSAPAGYPIINYEYAVVKKTQPSAAEASAIKAFLSWILTTGDTSKYLSATYGTAIPSATLSVSQSLVSSLSS